MSQADGESKQALRRVLAAKRADAAIASPDAGEALVRVWRSALAARIPSRFQCVSGYVRFRTEIDPLPLMEAIAQDNADLCLPVTPDARGGSLTFRHWHPGDALEKSQFGVEEPRRSAPDATPTVLLVPLLGFDRLGHRLGYGQGHYDRTLAALRAKGPIVAVGLAYDAQEVQAVPTEPTDQALDWVLTPSRALRTPT